MVKPSEKNEVLSYLNETLSAIRQIKDVLAGKNKTLKTKAIMSMLTIIEARLDASHKFHKAGGLDTFPLTLQQDLYNPILEWLAKEIA